MIKENYTQTNLKDFVSLNYGVELADEDLPLFESFIDSWLQFNVPLNNAIKHAVAGIDPYSI